MRAAVKNKFRPILMTSIAAILGIVPMAFGNGIGSEMRSSCGVPVIGGLVSSTILALYVIPALYILFAGRKKKKGPDRAGLTPAEIRSIFRKVEFYILTK